MKKNTLLYLEKSLVEKAKKTHLNISEITERALREELQEYRDNNDPSYILENSTVHFLPYKVLKVKLKNHPVLNNSEFSFKKTNLILGNNASGKTLLLDVLKGQTDARDTIIDIAIWSKKKIKDFYECILIDDALDRLTEESQQRFISWVKKKYKDLQLIMTSLRPVKGFENVIKLKSDLIDAKPLLDRRNYLASELNVLEERRCQFKKDKKKTIDCERKIACINQEIMAITDKLKTVAILPPNIKIKNVL